MEQRGGGGELIYWIDTLRHSYTALIKCEQECAMQKTLNDGNDELFQSNLYQL